MSALRACLALTAQRETEEAANPIIYQVIIFISAHKLYSIITHGGEPLYSNMYKLYHTTVLYSRDRYEIVGLRKSSHSIKQPCSSICLKKAFAMHQNC